MDSTVTFKSSSKRGRHPYLTPQEAKKRRLERYRMRRKRMVHIGEAAESWQHLRLELDFENDASLAEFLIDYYRSHSVSMMMDSNPKARSGAVDRKRRDDSSNASPTSSSGKQSEQPIRSSLIVNFSRSPTPQLLSAVGLYTIDRDTDTDCDKDSTEVVEDSVDVTEYLLPDNFTDTGLRDYTIEEEVLNIINDEVASGEEESVPVSLASTQDENIHSLRTGIVFDTCLMSLAKKAFSRCECHNCNGEIVLELHVVATAMKVVSHCCHGHKSTWWSQPLIEGIPAGNIQLVSSIVLSGNNYRKIALMLKFLNMLPVDHQLFLKIQKSHVQPSVTSYWKKMQGEHFLELTHPIVVLGDRCNNSQKNYLTYTMMDNSTHKVLDIQVIDARKKARRLRNSESSGFQRAFQCLVQNGLDVSEIVTDADPQLLSMMKLKYPSVLHQIDLWHGIKTVHERLAKVTASGNNKDLKPWIRDIIRHFVYCCQHSHGDASTLMSRWRSILHHTVNMHEWQLGDGSTAASCEHSPLADKDVKDQKWLTVGSPAHHALREVVYDKWLTSHLSYFVQARVTNERELFHDHIQMYAAENFTYDYHRMFSESSKHWRAVPSRVEKQYQYFKWLRADIMKATLPTYTLRSGAKVKRVPASLSKAKIAQ
uniref:uncharacterized protein isoform X2 n=1 Tax=Pristiophorus japonicus TaxID=55135 RepID=UPI00398F3557